MKILISNFRTCLTKSNKLENRIMRSHQKKIVKNIYITLETYNWSPLLNYLSSNREIEQ